MPQALSKQARELKQCQQCFKSDSKEAPLQTCAKCKRAHYCSRECQVKDWKNHKRLCAMNREMRAAMKSDDVLIDETLATIGMTIADGENKMKKWVQYYKAALGISVVHALRLQTTPEACLTHLLTFTLVPKFTAENPPRKDKDIWTAFKVENIQVLSFEECIQARPELEAQFDTIALKTKNSWKENFKTIGFPITLIQIPCIRTTRFIPIGIEGPPEELVRWEPQWKENLTTIVEQGIAI
ncbi:hypothetical protein CVT25_014628 [Psilocybe cyanescens]|uniref:MYND-type domain-containing protein n=1 Tax=Psilocybe cyanescens TaxID=93625 RepID=A0A409WU23_PSICY|nr:hypothetical protein CVT25_014628 [Psilocybe cyanescens]